MKNRHFLAQLAMILVILAVIYIPIFADEIIVTTCDFESLQSAVEQANVAGGIITFDCEGTILFTDSLMLSNTITIDGGGVITFNGGLTSVDYLVEVNIYGITFENGNGIHNLGTLTIIDSTFKNNLGRAIRNYKELTIDNTIFDHNNLDMAHEAGGAIYNLAGRIKINDSQFTYNSVTEIGGAIFTEDSSEFIEINDSTFSNNSATGSGGAIWSGGRLHITGSSFVENVSERGGGGAIFNGNEMIVLGSTFTNNTAGSGGAISNTAYLTSFRTDFIGNSAFYGGAIDHTLGWVFVGEGLFADNQAKGDGGAIFNDGNSLLVYFMQFENNSAQNGGAIFNHNYLSPSLTTVTLSTFTENSALDNGSAIFNNTDGIVTITNSRFERNEIMNPTNRMSNSYYARETNGVIYSLGIINLVESSFLDNIPAPCLVRTDQLGNPIRQESNCEGRSSEGR
ncbi:MAG: hypothetical protein SFZ02_12925 [bacterium]|nr:hypothetical protein [bacterium]